MCLAALLVRIPKGLGEGTSRILGAFVATRVWQACMKRAGQEESARALVGLYVDEVVLANAKAVRAISSTKVKTDKIDARTLIELSLRAFSLKSEPATS